ncbi:TetR/AcrR family transcriptional regulator [Amycolatopsis sp. NPDC058986]|uniref:TetR/AcrR family transcriptional regulator n=1 Tax=unclassified Amycolatopsis TaxID=2618356 RepID=UPI0036725AF4
MSSRDQTETETRLQRRDRWSRWQGERRAQILTAAREVFLADGYHAAPMDEIAALAGITKPVLYRHFEGKLEMYLELLNVVGDHLVETVGTVLAATAGGAEERVRAVTHAYLEFATGGDGAGRLLLDSDVRGEPAVQEVLRRVEREVAEVVIDAVAADDALDQEQLALLGAMLTGAIDSAVRLWRDSDSASFDRQEAERFIARVAGHAATGALAPVAQRTAVTELDRRYAAAQEGRRHLVQSGPVEPAVVRPVPVSVYLESGADADEVRQAVLEVLDASGIEIVEERPPVIGSWFKLMLGRTKKAVTSAEMADIMTRIERAIEMPTLHKPQAEIDAARADAVAKLITALGSEQNACIQAGSVFLLKVDGAIAARNLTQREMAFLERNSRLLGSPREVLAALDEQAHSSRKADQVTVEDGAARVTVRRPDDQGCVGLTVTVDGGPANSYEVSFGQRNGRVPLSPGVTHVHADHSGKAVLRERELTITVNRLTDAVGEIELVLASRDGRATSYELDFA